MQRESCGLCGRNALEPILDLGATPLADVFPATHDEAVKVETYPLDLIRCPNCGLVQLSEIVPDDVLWNGYGFHTGASPALRSYFRDYAADIIAAQNGADVTQQLVIEIACNDGTMLQHFYEATYNTLGVEPAISQARVAEARGLNVIAQPFTAALGTELAGSFGQANIVIADNVLAHVADPLDFARGIKVLLAPEGRAYIEVQYLGDLIAGNGFDMIYHQHRSYFSLNTLAQLLYRAGLRIVHARHTPAQSGSLRIEVEHASPKRTRRDMLSQLRHSERIAGIVSTERWLEVPDTYGGLQMRADIIAVRLNEILAERTGGPTYAVGASAKATTLLNWTRAGAWVDGVLDLTPSKSGRYLPIGESGALAIGLDDGHNYLTPATLLLTAHNYAGPIIRKIVAAEASNMPRIIIPLPTPIVL